MSNDPIASAAARLMEARRKGTRIALTPAETPQNFAQGYAIQDAVVAGLGAKTVGWKILPTPTGEMAVAPVLGEVPANGTWTVRGGEPAGLEVEIAFKMRATVSATASREQILDAVGSAHVVFELCQSRLTDPSDQPRHVAVADCVANTAITVGDAFGDWRSKDLREIPGRLMVDGRMHKDGKSVDPLKMLTALPAALAARGKQLEAGQVVITGSLVGMNWLEGRHTLEGVIDGCGRVAITLDHA
jgi:2-keto-4-pentenoate hydratase